MNRWTLPLLAAAALAAPAADRPNVLILFNDDHRPDALGALGTPAIQTPHLDRLAGRGLNFRRAYMQGAFTAATCIPSRAMLLTGRDLFHVDKDMLRDEPWPALFARAGYATFATGKWHNGTRSIPLAFQKGRALFASGMASNPLNAPIQDLDGGAITAKRPSGKHLCEAFADAAIQFIAEQPRDTPFLCYVAFDGPHDPHIVPDDFPVRYDPAKIPLPPNFMPQHPFDNGELNVRDELLLPRPRSPEQIRAMLADYHRYISYLDMLSGRILDALAASPHASNTIVVFAADSGVARGSHGLIGKQNLYEHSVRVPLVVAGPGVAAGAATDALCYLHDLFPTLAALCAIPAPAGREGRDFSKVLRDPKQPARADLHFAYKGFQQGLATADWKLIRYPRAKEIQLFNLRDDPSETDNLAREPRHATRLRELNATLDQHLARSGRPDESGKLPQSE